MTQGLRIAFRTTAGERVGFGHLRRCLSLARALRQSGAESVFLADGPPIALSQVTAEGFRTIAVAEREDPALRQIQNTGATAVVTDSYALGLTQLAALGTLGVPLIAIDDLGDGLLDVDLVINSSAGAERLRYASNGRTGYLLGPRYALLRPEFSEPPEREIRDWVRRVLITVGGSDPHQITRKLVAGTVRALPDVQVDVVIGPGFSDWQPVSWTENRDACQVARHQTPPDMRSLMLAADLAVCGGGQTTYELAATGTPAVAVRLADNQTANLEPLAKAGTLVWAGDAEDPDLETKVGRALVTLALDEQARARMSAYGRTLVDGQGADRVALAVMELALEAQE